MLLLHLSSFWFTVSLSLSLLSLKGQLGQVDFFLHVLAKCPTFNRQITCPLALVSTWVVVNVMAGCPLLLTFHDLGLGFAKAVTSDAVGGYGWCLGKFLARCPLLLQHLQRGAGITPCPLQCGQVLLWPWVTNGQSLSIWSLQVDGVEVWWPGCGVPSES